LIGEDGSQVGIVPIKEALDRARGLNLDLVEVSPDSRPPVCRIMDYGKFKYELAKKDKMAKKKAHAFQMKEMRFRPKIDEHDYQFKMKHVREFLMTGSKVRTFVLFRGREMTRIDFGQKLLERLAQDLTDIATVDMQAKMEGRSLTMVVSPRPEVVKHAQAARTVKQVEKEHDKEHEKEEEPEKTLESPSEMASDTEKIEN